MQSGTLDQTLRMNAAPHWSLAFSQNGNRLAVGNQVSDVVRLWDTRNGKLMAKFRGHERGVGALEFSPDGNTLASADCQGTVRLWVAGDYGTKPKAETR